MPLKFPIIPVWKRVNKLAFFESTAWNEYFSDKLRITISLGLLNKAAL